VRVATCGLDLSDVEGMALSDVEGLAAPKLENEAAERRRCGVRGAVLRSAAPIRPAGSTRIVKVWNFQTLGGWRIGATAGHGSPWQRS
jgi:hypothetical protein